MGTAFNNTHRYFTQFMLSNGIVTLDNAMKFFEEISPERNTLAFLKTLVIEINREICKQSFKIATTICEITGDKVFVWLNTKSDELSRLQVGFSAVELEYFHAILQEIVTSDDHTIQYPRAINIASTLTATLSRDNGEKALIRWIKGGYYVKQDERVFLGPRTILEFTTFLRTNTENCSCDLCSELVFVGETCNSCSKTFHKLCINKYLQNQQSCPSCRNTWGDPNSTMDVDSDADPRPSRRRRHN
ncbi:hypothetical protein Zmor_019452 [Zophobas morio]|uniref:Non-structural maintenance of chromosomes element 1 homolog n=1 Tax=Zophobas morio TaxID=2755281 RepID=A0AA38I1Y6_9CUCU|nr:hypothetical protein Zmor_019452 [Zophobas morio]